MAYANRSACWFHLKRFAECLVDIELAESAGYPAHLMPKLKKRQADCLKLNEEGVQEPNDINSQIVGTSGVRDDLLKLSFEPDERFSCMANVLKFEQNAKSSPIMVAKDDIEVGKTIAAEKAFTTCLYTKFDWRCNICLKGDTNLIPCEKCNAAMFCSKSCQDSSIHGHECGQRFCKSAQTNGFVMEEVRIMFKAIEIFSNVDELMAFVEQAIQR